MVHTMTRSAGLTKSIKVYLVLIIIGGVAFVASLLIGTSLCLFYNLVGIPCFSCGMTRAFMSLPNIFMAFRYHPLFFTVPIIPFLLFFSEKNRNIASIALIVLFIGVWAVRMFLFFPHTAPMEYNENALIGHFLT